MKHKGNVMAIISVTLVIILGVVSLVTDIGIVLVERNKLQYGLDAAVLAAVKEMQKTDYDVNQVVNQYLVLNDVDPNNVTIEINHTDGILKLSGELTVQTIFARVLGINTVDVGRSSAAQIGTASSVDGGLRPFAIPEDTYVPGETQVILKSEDGVHGNYGPVALGGSGASVLRDNALNGYNGSIKIGDMIDTEPGNMAGIIAAIRQKLNDYPNDYPNQADDSFRLWVVPIIENVIVSGRDSVEVVGFATVYVEGVNNSGGDMEIVGRFVDYVAPGDIDFNATSYGVYASKLVQ
jgi:hypothetical protein